MKRTKRMKTLSSILLSILLFLLAGCSGTLPPILSPPTGVLASDASYTDIVQITWDTVSGASHYQVYRADTLLGAKMAISGWQNGTSYDDTNATLEEVYYYWVKAATSSIGDNATGFSSPDTGYAILIIISTKEKIGQDKGTFRLSYLNK